MLAGHRLRCWLFAGSLPWGEGVCAGEEAGRPQPLLLARREWSMLEGVPGALVGEKKTSS